MTSNHKTVVEGKMGISVQADSNGDPVIVTINKRSEIDHHRIDSIILTVADFKKMVSAVNEAMEEF